MTGLQAFKWGVAMSSNDDDIREFQRQLQQGGIRRAYTKIIEFMGHLRRHFTRSGVEVSSLYQGTFTITYFAIFPEKLKSRDLKIGVVFNYETFQFEAWLLGRNRFVQNHFRERLTTFGFQAYPMADPRLNPDAIVVTNLLDEWTFEDEEHLTEQIVSGVAAFQRAIVEFLEAKEIWKSK